MSRAAVAVALLTLAPPATAGPPWAPPSDGAAAAAATANAEAISVAWEARWLRARARTEPKHLDRAIRQFEMALARWDHPGIHYNLAVTLSLRGRPSDALRHLWAAARYGGAPLETRRIAAASWLDAKLRERVALLVVTADADLAVARAGAPLPFSHGAWRDVSPAAPMVLLVTRPGAAPTPLALTPPAGLRTRVALHVDASGAVHADVTVRAAVPADWDAVADAIAGFAVRWPTTEELAAWDAAEHARIADDPPYPSAPPWRGTPGDRCAHARGPRARVCADRDAAHAALRDLASRIRRSDDSQPLGFVEALDPLPPRAPAARGRFQPLD